MLRNPPRILHAMILVMVSMTFTTSGVAYAAEAGEVQTAKFHRSPLHPMGNLDFMLETLSRPGAYHETVDMDHKYFGFASSIRRKPIYVLVSDRGHGRTLSPGWKVGPPPAGTIWFGGVVLNGEAHLEGFHFADFRGDHVRLDSSKGRRVEFKDIAYYTNPILLPHRVSTSLSEAYDRHKEVSPQPLPNDQPAKIDPKAVLEPPKGNPNGQTCYVDAAGNRVCPSAGSPVRQRRVRLLHFGK
jgi:hypothetical protein